jgi:RND family efflux transporter MFP subunit
MSQLPPGRTIIGAMKLNNLAVVLALGAALSAGVVAASSVVVRSDGKSGVNPGAGTLAPPVDFEALAAKFGGAKADTKASQDTVMAFGIPVQVKDIVVEGGQAVKKGDLLIRARDADQVAIVEGQRIQAASEYEIQAADLAMKLAKLKFERLKESGTFSPAEKDELETQYLTGVAQLEQAKTKHELEKMRLAQAEGQLERYRLEAPFDGIVEEVKVEVGQGVRESDGAIRVVNTAKLRLDAYAPTHETIELAIDKGHKAWVLVDLPGKPRLVEGAVQYISPVADSVSQRRRVRVEVVNTEGWPAGTQAQVRFTDPGGAWDEYRAGGKALGAAPGAGGIADGRGGR